MTHQVEDIFVYDSTRFAVAAMTEEPLFDLLTINLKTDGATTACYRGYQCTYSLLNGALVLLSLHACLHPSQHNRDVLGVAPTESTDDPLLNCLFTHNYHNLNHPIAYTGSVTLGDGFIQELHRNMGFHPPWKYERVLELAFHNGQLESMVDRSQEMAETRDQIINAPTQSLFRSLLTSFRSVRAAFDRTSPR